MEETILVSFTRDEFDAVKSLLDFIDMQATNVRYIEDGLDCMLNLTSYEVACLQDVYQALENI